MTYSAGFSEALPKAPVIEAPCNTSCRAGNGPSGEVGPVLYYYHIKPSEHGSSAFNPPTTMATDTSLPPGDSRFTLYHMDTAIEFLKKAGPQQWPQTYRGPHIADTQFTAHTATLLADFIDASYVNNGYVQAIFWEQLSKCDNGLARSSKSVLLVFP